MSNDGDVKRFLEKALEKALVAQQPIAHKNVERLRRIHPSDTPHDLIMRLNRYYLTTVTTSGGATGATATVPGAAIGLALGDVLVFTEASVLYALSLSEIHGIHPEDVERRKLLVLTILLGDSAISALDKTVGRTGPYWARQIVNAIPLSAINRINKVLGPRFVTKYGTKQGVLVLSKQVPLGIGAVFGASGNHIFGRLTVKSAARIFGPPPEDWPTPHGDAGTGNESMGV